MAAVGARRRREGWALPPLVFGLGAPRGWSSWLPPCSAARLSVFLLVYYRTLASHDAAPSKKGLKGVLNAAHLACVSYLSNHSLSQRNLRAQASLRQFLHRGHKCRRSKRARPSTARALV